jgi:hypothetical protein
MAELPPAGNGVRKTGGNKPQFIGNLADNLSSPNACALDYGRALCAPHVGFATDIVQRSDFSVFWLKCIFQGD